MIKYLILFTNSFPFVSTGEYTFIEPELSVLCKSFTRIFLVPQSNIGNLAHLPPNVEVDESYAKMVYQDHKIFSIFYALRSSFFWEELISRPKLLIQFAALKRLVFFLGYAELTYRWFQSFVERHDLPYSETFCYTYWFDWASFALGRLKLEHPSLKVVSRAHGVDLYEERHPFSYIPCREKSIALLDRLFLISKNGRDYLAGRYPSQAKKFEIFRLGVLDPGFLSKKSTDRVHRLVSCSHAVPVKRLPMLLDSLEILASNHPECRFLWTHLGDGSDLAVLKKRRYDLPDNLSLQLPGYLPNEGVLLFYQNNPVDLFLNISASEGIPVSIMEAQSCGIPVLATKVGGTPEIVDPENGFLVERNVSTEELAGLIWIGLNDPNLDKKRQLSRLSWQKGYNAEVNYEAFSEKLYSL